MTKFPVLIIALIAIVVMALPSQALSPVRLGEKNFERGWLRLVDNSRDAANDHFSTGADAFAEALAQDPRSRSTNFDSNLTKAGMSFYYAGRYDESIKAMAEVYNEKTTLWESAIYPATAYAFLGDKTKTLEWLKVFHNMYSGQHDIANTAVRVIKDLEKGNMDVRQAAATLDKALTMQFIRNVGLKGQNHVFGNEKCSGSYWWRFNRKPCKRKRLMDNN